MFTDQRRLTSRFTFVLLFFLAVASFIFYGYLKEDYSRTSLQIYSKTLNNTQDLCRVNIYKSLWEMSNNLKNYWLYFRDIISQSEKFNQTKHVDDGYVALNSDLIKVIQSSESERKNKLEQMSLYIQSRIYHLQHPDDCEKARILICDINNKCGFGCSLHSLINYLMRAFVSGRTLVYRSKGWRYAAQGWTYAFLPLSNCTDDRKLTSVPNISGKTYSKRVVSMKNEVEPWSIWSIPAELEPELKRLHGHPFVWWIGQFTAYALRPQPWLKNELQKVTKMINFTSSVVGVQVRWGDKLNGEAKKHAVSEYMNFVERWYEQLEHQGRKVERTVYLATESAEALNELNLNYPNYKFIGSSLAITKFNKKARYQSGGLESVVFDIYFLSQCDYLVCTLSSAVCRVAYELFMNHHVDASLRFQTIDTGYRLKNNFLTPMIAIMNHDPVTKDELELRKGDKIFVTLDAFVATNDGFLRGKNERTKKRGKFPVFKAREQLFSYNVSELRLFGFEQ